MLAVFIFSGSAILLAFFLGLKIWELKKQRRFWLTKFLSDRDARLRRISNTLTGFFKNLWSGFVRKTKFLLLNFLPFLLGIIFKKFKVFMFENFKKIKDNVRGKYRKLHSPKPSSKYLEEISKAKDLENNGQKNKEE